MLKFADPAATQFQGLADRIALAVYGNTEKYIRMGCIYFTMG